MRLPNRSDVAVSQRDDIGQRVAGVGTPLSFGHLPQGGDLRCESFLFDGNVEYL